MKRWLMYVVVIGLVSFWPIAGALAHPGHAHKVMGTVTAIQDNRVEVKDAEGKTTIHLLDVKTKIRRGRAVLRAADIKVGDRVVISSVETKGAAGKAVMTVTNVQVGVTPATTPAKKG